jgi:hypothetical protein
MQIANDAMDNRPAPTTTTAARTSATPSSEATEAPLRAKRQAASSAISAHSSRTSSHAASATGHCANTPYKLNPQLPNGSPLVPADGAAGDPPSLGVAVLMADKATNGGTRNHSTYGEAAQSQLNFTLYHVPQVRI